MAYQFIFTAWFDRNLKALGKHNPNLRGEFESFLKNLSPAEEREINGLIRQIRDETK